MGNWQLLVTLIMFNKISWKASWNRESYFESWKLVVESWKINTLNYKCSIKLILEVVVKV